MVNRSSALGPLLIGAVLLACKEKPPPPPIPVVDTGDFRPMGPPQPGDWLTHFDEPGQTFEQYAGGSVNRKSEARAVIFIRPLGDVMKTHGATIEAMREYAEVFYQTEARLLEPQPMPGEAHHEKRGQYSGDRILTHLANDRPPRALMVVGLTADDLFSGNLNFVFGVGSIGERVGVYSLHRYGAEGDPEFLRRALKVMSHEAGHVLSIQHCTAYQCVMNGSNSLSETDRQPMHLCPVDLNKVVWNTGCDARRRYDALEAYYEKHGLADEAAFVSRIKGKLK